MMRAAAVKRDARRTDAEGTLGANGGLPLDYTGRSINAPGARMPPALFPNDSSFGDLLRSQRVALEASLWEAMASLEFVMATERGRLLTLTQALNLAHGILE
jgi:hypothetical protein